MGGGMPPAKLQDFKGTSKRLLRMLTPDIGLVVVMLLLAVTRLPERRYEALYVLAPVACLLHPLVEQRYYLPALVLFNAWRPSAGPRVERLLLGLWIPAALAAMYGIARGAFFL